jgi:arylsulfatase A-like enzyme
MNVLFVITDQQRADHVGFGGNEIVQTPHLDRVAAGGTIFDNAWVGNPVCMPNRSTIMTGRMPSVHGVITNDRSLEWGANTHVRQFRRAGWRTALIGKSHLQLGRMLGHDDHDALAATVDHGYPAGWDTYEQHGRYHGDTPDMPDDFYGFDHVEFTLDHGARMGGHHLRWCLDRGGRYEDLVGPQTSESPADRRSDRWWQLYQPPYPPELHSTNFVVERTIDFIRQAAADDQPWLAWASFPDPHHPMAAPGDWFDRYDPTTIPLPETFDDTDLLPHLPAYLRRMRNMRPSDQAYYVTPFGTDDRDLIREYLAVTYGLIEFVDEGVGRILAALDELGIADDTIVVFTSDHGDMAGDHGLCLKGLMPFRGVLQVPLVVADPRRSPARTDALAGSIDIGATLMDLCDVPPHDGIQGRSLVPVLDVPESSVRTSLLIEDDIRVESAQRRGSPSRIRTVIADELKYSRFSDGSELLFDIGKDPHEVDELAHRGGPRLERARNQLIDALMTHTDEARGVGALASN